MARIGYPDTCLSSNCGKARGFGCDSSCKHWSKLQEYCQKHASCPECGDPSEYDPQFGALLCDECANSRPEEDGLEFPAHTEDPYW